MGAKEYLPSYTYADYKEWEGEWELYEGYPISMSPSPIINHQAAKRDENYKFETYEKEKVKYYVIVYPDDLKAKVYKLKDLKYDKQGYFSKEGYEFEDTLCKAYVDFGKVFKRFRK